MMISYMERSLFGMKSKGTVHTHLEAGIHLQERIGQAISKYDKHIHINQDQFMNNSQNGKI